MFSSAAVRASLVLSLLAVTPVAAADWPTWRYDARRSAASPHDLPPKLHLQWVRYSTPAKPAWPDQPKMQFDAVNEPIVMGQTVFFGSAQSDCVMALSVETGEEKWRFFAEGPVRFAPLAWEGRLFFVSDDGYLYCLDAEKGTLLWKCRGGPSERKVLGNERLISTWPARGAPVLADGTVYFAAGIWPFMGIFVHALDARTGKAIWTNDGDGSIYIKQPHNADSFAGVAPQGPLVIQGDVLLVPGGRSVPALLDRKTGKLLRYQLAENGKRGGGSEVVAVGPVFLNGGAAFETASEQYLGEFGKFPVANEDVLFCWTKDVCRSFDLRETAIKAVQTTDRKGKKVRVPKWEVKETGSCPLPKAEALIRAGSRLYAGAKDRIWAVELPLVQEKSDRTAWELPIEGTPRSLVAAADRLLVATVEGQLYCFGPEPRKPATHPLRVHGELPETAWTAQAKKILETAKVNEGYALVWGAGNGSLIDELALHSKLQVVALDSDAAKVQTFRELRTSRNRYGDRLAALVGEPTALPLPPYLASLIFVEQPPAGVDWLPRLFQMLRPFGGIAYLQVGPAERATFLKNLAALQLPGAKVQETSDAVLLIREGPLPGSANWTHEHADAANTRVSRDTLVQAPLGLLWFGGPSHDSILPRHGHGPQPQVIDGRMLIEGMDALRCVDIYAGRLLWEVRLPGLGKFYNNLAHQPGANATGTNFISTADGIYVVHGKRCLRLDAATGQKLAEFTLPPLPGQKEPPLWGYINVVGDTLIGGSDPLLDPKLFAPLLAGGDDPVPGSQPEKPGDKGDLISGLLKKVPRMDNDNLSSSKHLVVMDRQTGAVRWTASARLGFRHNAICVGGTRLYAIDRLSGPELARMKRRGQEPSFKPRLVVFDLQTGREQWQTEAEVFGTWLSYSAKHDVLVEAGRVARDSLVDEAKGMRAYRARTGEVLWDKPAYVGPAMIHGDVILKDRSACDLLTGEPTQRRDPLTGAMLEWTWVRNYGCNTPMASQHLLTFRSGAAGFFDLAHDGGTGNLGGFRSGCTNNLLVAGGLLIAPDYTRTCSCNYQNQTSLAFVHMPEAEMWTFFGARPVKGPVRQVGINLGAPGNRKADDGTLWLEFPRTGGPSPSVPVQISPANPTWFRRHASQVSGEGLPWVTASGGKGITSVTLTLDSEAAAGRMYRVRLYFLEPDEVKPGQRVFQVALQGVNVLKDFDIVKETGGPNRGLVKEFRGIEIMKNLTVLLTPSTGTGAVLCGIEVLAEGW